MKQGSSQISMVTNEETNVASSVNASRTRLSQRTWRAVAILFAAVAAIVSGLGLTTPAHAAGNYGPDTCLQGWVWREATPTDHVCVTPDTRTQTANDNSQAGARRDPNGGPYGPDTCLQGWVWREAVANDHVCVTTATRSQAASDNSQAAARVDSLRLWGTTYTVGPVCSNGTCSSTSTDSIPRYRLYGDHINTGVVYVRLFRIRDGVTLHTWSVNATAGASGGQFSLDTNTFSCGAGAADSYFRVYDPVSTRWSDPYYVKTICNVL